MKYLRRRPTLLLAFCFFIIGQALRAQGIIIGDAKEDPSDQTANTAGTIVEDPNGKKCALLKIAPTPMQRGFMFSTGASVTPVRVEEPGGSHPAEYWVYLSAGTKKIEVQHGVLGKATKRLPTMKAGVTYQMTLTCGEVQQIVTEAQHQQYVVLRVEPQEAIATFDGEDIFLENGEWTKLVEFGTHEVSVKAKNYHNYASRIQVNDPKNKMVFNIRLKPNFGWINVEDTLGISGAEVWIDGEKKGVIPYRSQALSSGQHQVRVVKNLYKPLTTMVTVRDSAVSTLRPVLEANFAKTTFVVRDDAQAEIYIDSEFKAKGRWSGPLEAGNYRVEVKRENHRSNTQSIAITASKQGEEIELNPPTPIYGTLRIETTPSGASVSIDGERRGDTPLLETRQLIGSHRIVLSREGYSTVDTTLVILENETTTMQRRLSNVANFTVYSTPADASIWIDGRYLDHTPVTLSASVGKHRVQMQADGYANFDQNVTFDQSTINLQMQATRKTVYVSSNKYISSLYVDGEYNSSPSGKTAELVLDYGKHTLRAVSYKSSGEKEVTVSAYSPSRIVVNQKRNYINKNMFYFDAVFQPFGLTNFGGGMGFFAGGFNMEGHALLPLGCKDEVYALDNSDESTIYYSTLTCKAKSSYTARVGWGFKLGKRVQLTPQAGVDFVNAKFYFDADEEEQYKASVVSGVIGARFYTALAGPFGLLVTPQYKFAIKKSSDYEVLAKASDKIKAWGSGFEMMIGFAIQW